MKKTWAAMIWFLLTFALVVWWWIFALQLVSEVKGEGEAFARSYRMLKYEGSTLLSLLLIGGFSLVLYVYRDSARSERLRLFFMNFTHDIKTAIARLRLQSDVLLEQAKFTENPVLHRLLTDIGRLELQLENSLELADQGTTRLQLESIKLSEILSQVRAEFPDLEIALNQDGELFADRRGLISIFRNLFHNSLHHGKARRISLNLSFENNQAQIQFVDDGKGSTRPADQLGQAPLQSTESSGFGLYLCRVMVQKMKGGIEFSGANTGFTVILKLPLAKGALK